MVLMGGTRWLLIAILLITMVLSDNTAVPLDGTSLVIAHRGASSLAPENTMAAICAAIELGVDIVEVDVHRSADGELVVVHDSTVDRTTDGEGRVSRLTLEELKALDAGSWFKSSFREERIPTLREVLEAVGDRAIVLIELKAKRIELQTIELVQELGMSHQVMIQSFDSHQIQIVNQNAPDIPTFLLVYKPRHSSQPERAARWMISVAQYVGASGIGIRGKWFTPELLALAEEEDLQVFVWTVNSQPRLRKFIEAGVHGIITNRPQDLLALQNRKPS
jgi:glycerophosphoryl diester phosphodiesterase